MTFTPASRLDALPPYLFIEIDRRKRAALADGRDVIDFGVGDPDLSTPEFVIDRMAEAICDPKNHHYPLDAGVPEFKQAAAAWLARRFGVTVDPKTELLALIGSKEGLGHLPLAVINPGDVALIPSPGYPVYRAATLLAGGAPHVMPLKENQGFLPDLEAIDTGMLDKTSLMFLNYPNNPTGAVAPLDFYERCVALAKQHDFVVCSDAPYTELYFNEHDRPHSMLAVPGAKDVCIEMHSLSKTFNMTGWRIAFAAGNRDVIAALAKVKGNMDSGAFNAIQHAAATALRGADRPEVARNRSIYKERRDLLVPRLNQAGFRVEPPRATFYVWARCPKGYDSMRCVSRMLEEAAIVAVPGIGFGEAGEGYIRFALTVDLDRIATAADRLARIGW